MSPPKFETLSAGLLARKGDAAPSVVVPAMAPPRRPLIPRDDRPMWPEPPPFPSVPPQSDRDKLRRIVISIPHEDLEKLCIVAIKRGVTRHDIMRGALHDYLRKLAAEFTQPCACMEVDSCGSGTAWHDGV